MFYSNGNNIEQTDQFICFIDPRNRNSNFNFFQSLQLDDEENAKIFYSKLLVDKDFYESSEMQILGNLKKEEIEETDAKIMIKRSNY